MEARTQLAALDHNFNVGRHQAKTSSGELCYESQFSRHKGDYVAKQVYVEKSYDDVGQLMNKVQQAAFGCMSRSASTSAERVWKLGHSWLPWTIISMLAGIKP